jgi:hypothetical protein
VDRRDERGGDETAVRQWEEVEAVVDDVELGGVFEKVGDVRALGDLRVDAVVLGPSPCARAAERGGRLGIGGGEQGDVVAGGDQAIGEERGEQLPGPVVARRGAPGDRREDSDPQGWCRWIAMAARGDDPP